MIARPKVLIQNQGPLGGAVEQVTLDTNRLDTLNETHTRLYNFIAVSSRGLWIDTSKWVIYSAAFGSFVSLLTLTSLPLWIVSASAGVPMLIFSYMLCDAVERRKTLRAHVAVRLILLFVGALIGVLVL